MSEHKSLLEARERAQQGIGKLRNALREELGERSDIIVGVNGSYARREVTPGSDVDIFFLGTHDIAPADAAQSRFLSQLEKLGFKAPAYGGVFESPLTVATLRDNIGGSGDNNETITRRMLFLLEGDWLFNEAGFRKARAEILSAYLRDTFGEGHLSKFFLNDVVRYWRTICVDYENKVRFRGKARGIRYIKLRFSRLLLYFAGVLAAAETYDLPKDEKQARLAKLLDINPLDRIRHIAGNLAEPAIRRYSEFLAALSDDRVRAELEDQMPDYDGRESYLRLRESAGRFREELIEVLYGKYGPRHEIIKALLI